MRFGVLGPSFNAWHDFIWPLNAAPFRHVWHHGLHWDITCRVVFWHSMLYFSCLWSTADHTDKQRDIERERGAERMPFSYSDVKPIWSSWECSVFCSHSSMQCVHCCSLLRALCYDSGMCATTCNGSLCSVVSQPDEKHDGQNLHIKKDPMPDCKRLDRPRWLLFCPTYCSLPASSLHPLSSS